jgi:protein-disulfide isomerase
MSYQMSAVILIMIFCSLRSPIRPDHPIDRKPVSLVIFSDYQSPICREASAWLARLRRQYPEGLRILIKHFPTPGHAQSFLAARAAYCAACLGRFWDYHDRLFAASDLTEPMLIKYAAEIALDEFEFEQCLESDASREAVEEDRKEAAKLRLASPPAFILDGRVMLGVRSFDDLLREVRAARVGKS